MEADNSPQLRGQRCNLTFGLHEILGRAIVGGDYRVRPFPTESDLAKLHGVSRSVTREAVKMLGAKGLLAARAGQGTFVRPIEAWSLLDTDVLRWLLEHKRSIVILRHSFELCLAVQPAACALAATYATADQLAEIRSKFERAHAAQQNGNDFVEADIAFQGAILNASNNPFFSKLREFVSLAILGSNRFDRTSAYYSRQIDARIALHQAIATQHPSEAIEAMKLLLSERQRLIEQGVKHDSYLGDEQ